MERRGLLLAGGTALLFGCATGGQADPMAKRREIDAGVDTALSTLASEGPGVRELVARARGVLVFPRVVTAGFIVGGSYGEGALRKGGATTAYYNVREGSVGLLAGAESKAMYLLFMTQEALQKFEQSNGWTVGADASVTVAKVGADARVDTATAQAPIVGIVRTNSGLMANLSIDGTRFTRLAI